VLITYSFKGITFTSYNLNLFKQATYDNLINSLVCLLNSPLVYYYYKPAICFFIPCKGAAYIFPKDNTANIAYLANLISCYIKTLCVALTW
jgi:hypothetical protein